MRAKLTELLKTTFNEQHEKRHMITHQHTADYLIANGVIVQEQGRWEECDWVDYDGHSECVHYPQKGCVCTNCRNAFKKEFINNPRVNHCPHCGAKMEQEGDNA